MGKYAIEQGKDDKQNMRFNRLRLIFALISAILLSLYCSRSDVVTGAGGSVVKDFDPTLTDPNGGFVQVSIYDYDGAADSAFSLPGSSDPLFGTHVSGGMLVGVSGEGDTLAAHVQYSASGDTSSLYNEKSEFVSASIYFPTADTLGAAPPDAAIPFFICQPLSGLAPVNRADTLSADGAGSRVGAFSLGAAGAADSVRLDASAAASAAARRLFEARKSKDTAVHETAAFSVVGYAGALRKVGDPYIVITIKEMKGFAEELKPDTIRGFARYTAFENEAAAAARANEAYSSQLTRRTAVFRVNLDTVFKTLSGRGLLNAPSVNNSLLLNAVVAVCVDTLKTGRPFGNYKALVLDTLLVNETLLDDIAGSRLLYKEFDAVGSAKPALPYRTHPFEPAMRGVINRYAGRQADKPYEPYIYVYLRPVTEGSVIRWAPPKFVETVFTPSRSQSR